MGVSPLERPAATSGNYQITHGAEVIPFGTWARAFTTWRFAPITTLVLLAAPLLYVAAVIAAGRQGERWPLARTACFAGGLVVVSGHG